jgi:hypothetical protein
MQLSELMQTYLLEHNLQANTATQLRYAVLGLERFSGGTLDVKMVTSELLNRYVIYLSEKRSLRYAKHHRTWLMSLLRAAAEMGELEEIPKRVRQVKVPQKVPSAWTPNQVSLLATQASSLEGVFRLHPNVPKRKWFHPFVLVRWDTALRLKDCLSIERTDIWPGGRISIVQSKTGQCHTVLLRETTIQALSELWKLTPGSRMILPQLCELRHLYAEFSRLVKASGLDGTSRKLRASAATAAEQMGEGLATRLLGHRTPDLARKHYIDPRLIHRAPVLPPALPELMIPENN